MVCGGLFLLGSPQTGIVLFFKALRFPLLGHGLPGCWFLPLSQFPLRSAGPILIPFFTPLCSHSLSLSFFFFFFFFFFSQFRCFFLFLGFLFFFLHFFVFFLHVFYMSMAFILMCLWENVSTLSYSSAVLIPPPPLFLNLIL